MNEQSMTVARANQSLFAKSIRNACVAGLGLLAIGCFSASGVTYVSDTRSTTVSAQGPSTHTTTPNTSVTDTPAMAFIDRQLSASGTVCWQQMNGWTPAPTTGTARQDATFTPTQISVNSSLSVSAGGDPYGSHYAPGCSGTVTASSLFEVEFSVATATQYNYMFNFDPTSTLTAASLWLVSDTHGSQQLFRTSGAYVSGILAPDTYTLQFVFASTAIGAQSGYNSGVATFNFAPAPVPEPTTFAVFGLGLVALGVWCRKEQTKR